MGGAQGTAPACSPQKIKAKLGTDVVPISLAQIFEAFNATNTMYDTAVNQTAYTATGLILKPLANFGIGTQSQGFPDGTNARRCQVSLRLNF